MHNTCADAMSCKPRELAISEHVPDSTEGSRNCIPGHILAQTAIFLYFLESHSFQVALLRKQVVAVGPTAGLVLAPLAAFRPSG
jgi:hypothetical protein